MNQVAELLEKAADALESGRIQWGKYTGYKKPLGTMCAEETLAIVAMEESHLGLVISPACWAVSRHVTKGRNANHLTAWSDTEARTLDEVVQAFKETAKDLRNEAS